MTRSKRMQPVVEVTALREREAARRLGELLQREQADEQRLQELTQYRDDYTRQFASGTSLGAARLQDYRIFLGRLNQAIVQQQAVVERARQACAAQRAHWLALQTRVQALDKVVTRYRDRERSDQDRREQGESDQRAHTPRGRTSDDD
ncbi:MAG: flagellar export protein FliJ [Gammaproteobacteria bacterium]